MRIDGAFLALFASSIAYSVVDATETCNDNDLMTSSSAWVGEQLGNITFDMDPLYAGSTCCSIATGFSSVRSDNITDGLPFQMSIVGPPDDPGHVGQFSYACIVFDYGATLVTLDNAVGENSTTGVTPDLPPFPPPPPPCNGFSDRNECINQDGFRCWWTEDVGCDESPPIECAENVGGDPPPPFCFHIGTNTSRDLGPWKLVGVDSFLATVYVAPPDTFMTDAYFSISNGQESLPEPHLEPFQFCAEYASTVDEREVLEVCVKLTGVYDASWAVGEDSDITLGAAYVNSPIFAINYIVNEDGSDVKNAKVINTLHGGLTSASVAPNYGNST